MNKVKYVPVKVFQAKIQKKFTLVYNGFKFFGRKENGIRLTNMVAYICLTQNKPSLLNRRHRKTALNNRIKFSDKLA